MIGPVRVLLNNGESHIYPEVRTLNIWPTPEQSVWPDVSTPEITLVIPGEFEAFKVHRKVRRIWVGRI